MKTTRNLLEATLTVTSLLFIGGNLAAAQNNFEIQVYSSATLAPKTTMVDLHSALIADGSKPIPGSIYAPGQLYPTNDALHETPEITLGITSWSDASFYIFTAAQSGRGWQWVGDHIRPQVHAPDSWHWPMGAGLSIDFGYQRPYYSTDTWTVEITPIVDKQLGRWYFALNPSFDRSLHGQNVPRGFGFSPSVKCSYDFTKYISGGVEYYGNYGSPSDIYSFHNQQQQFFSAIGLNVSPGWAINFGIGIGVTATTDDWIYKANIGRRFDWTHHRAGR